MVHIFHFMIHRKYKVAAPH